MNTSSAAPEAVSAPTRTLQRGLAVLEALANEARDGGLGVSDVAASVDLDKATANRLLQTLCTLGYAYKDPDTRLYKLTGKLLALSEQFQFNLDVPRRIAPFLAQLRNDTGETVHYGVQELDRVVYLSKLESTSPVVIASAVGQNMPIHTTALGKAIMAASSDAVVERTLARLDLEPRTAKSVRDPAEFRAEIAATRARGYSIDAEENQEGVTCVGSALVSARGLPVGAISVSGPTYRVVGRLEEIGRLCQGTAMTIRALL